MDPVIDRLDSQHKHKKSLELFKAYMEENMLCDIWRIAHPDLRQYTWYKYHLAPNFIRLDLFIINTGLAPFVTTIKHAPRFHSDHSFVEMFIEIDEIARGRGFWKFNNILLHKPEYIFKINNITANASANVENMTPDHVWELLKCKIIGGSIDFATRLAKEQKANYHVQSKNYRKSKRKSILPILVIYQILGKHILKQKPYLMSM